MDIKKIIRPLDEIEALEPRKEKVVYDYSKLLGRIRECGFSQVEVADAVPMSASQLNLKLNNKMEFRQREIFRIAEILGIFPEHIGMYFFTEV